MISNVVNSPVPQRKSHSPLSYWDSILRTPILPAVGLLTIGFMATFNLVNVELADEKVKLDSQLLLKLGVVLMAGIYGLKGFLLNSRVRKTLLNNTTVCLLAVSAAYLATAMLAINKSVAIVSSGCILCAILAMTTFCVQHGRQKSVLLIFYSISLFLVASWAAYLLFPAIGVFQEPLENGVFLERMGGLSHPNTLGQYSALGLVLGACLLRANAANRGFVIAVMLMAGLALYFSLSRTSTAAAMGGLAFVFRDRIFSRRWVFAGLSLLAIGSAAMLLGSAFLDMENKINDKIVSLLSKSSESSTDELTTATGRSAIWAKSVSLIKERPLYGWGAGSSKELLVDYSQYTHNLFLNVWLSTGLIGGLSISILILMMVYKIVVAPSMVPDAIFVLIFLNGLFENVIFCNVASAPTLVFTLAIIWRYVPKGNEEEEFDYDSANS